MARRVYLSYIFSILYILKLTTATPLTSSTPLESSPQTITSASTPLNASIQDFAASPTWNGTLLPPTACTITSIFALLDLALQDFTAPSTTKTWQTSSFPNLALSMTPAPNQNTTTVRWAIWGIASALKTMLATHRYETASFALTYGANPVGYVTYATTQTVAAPITKPQVEAASGPFGTTETEISISPTSQTGSDPPIMYTLANPTSTSQNSTSNAGSKLQIQLSTSSISISISQETYIAAIVNALVALAPQPANQRVDRWCISSPGVTDGVEISFQAVARSRGPYLEVGMVSRVLASLVGILMEGGVWREVDVGVFVGGVVVGEGAVRRGMGMGRGEGGGGWGVGCAGV